MSCRAPVILQRHEWETYGFFGGARRPSNAEHGWYAYMPGTSTYKNPINGLFGGGPVLNQEAPEGLIDVCFNNRAFQLLDFSQQFGELGMISEPLDIARRTGTDSFAQGFHTIIEI